MFSWCAAISCDPHIYYFYHQHAFKHRPLVPSAVEPPVLLLLRDVCEAILKVLQCFFAHILK